MGLIVKYVVMKSLLCLSALALSTITSFASNPTISGDYLEVRSCDVFTGSCFANSEMGLAGKEGMMFWSVREGAWKGTSINGLGVMLVLRTDATLGDLKYEPRSGRAVVIVDEKATPAQRAALIDFARTKAGNLVSRIVSVKSAPIHAKLRACSKAGCASVVAGDLVEITTSCMDSKHDICGNEEAFYPPLSKVDGAFPVFTDVATFTGTDLGLTWQISGKRSAYLGSFSL
jgi:hypothetical protein